ncbi:MAG: biotin--[acetyl-CoA-carboxylase] ligase [Betaproteobacteria bacterium]
MSWNRSELPSDVRAALDLVRPRLGRVGADVRYFPSIGSTNDVGAALAAADGHEGTVVCADEQTAGRGRRGRTWFSPPGAGLYVSVILQPGRSVDPMRATTLLTLTAGVALAEAIQTCTALAADIKWPNDLLVGGRKLAGILAEAVAAGPQIEAVVLGYGINIGPMAYPPDLSDRATSLETELGRAVDRALVFAESLAALSRRYDDLLAGRFDAILDAWRARAPGAVGAPVSWQSRSGPLSGVTAGIDGSGALLVARDGRIERLVAGEVTWAAGIRDATGD